MTPAPPPLVLLDLDGTLTDSAPGIMASARVAFAAMGLPVPDDAALRGIVGPPLVASFVALGVPPECAGEAVAAYRREYRATGMFDNGVFDGIGAQLVALRSAGLTLAVATSKPEVYARQICDRFGVSALVDGVFGVPLDELTEVTKADVITRALVELGQQRVPAPERCLMVGDREHDVVGARERGIRCLAVGWGYAREGELAEARPVAVVDRVADLAGAVLALVGPGPGRVVDTL